MLVPAGPDPALAAGMMMSAQVLFGHAAEDADPLAQVPVGPEHQFTAGPQAHLRSLFGWVRSSLYTTDFLRDLDWSASYDTAGAAGQILFSYCSRNAEGARKPHVFCTLDRPGMSVFSAQLSLMRNYLDQRPERATEILSQVSLPNDYMGSILGLTVSRNPLAHELMTFATNAAAHTAMIAKHHLACRRPGQIGAVVLPMLPTPDHGAFPAAHAAEVFSVATVLSGLIESDEGKAFFPAGERLAALLHKQAERISVNRTVAGLHFPVDSWAGAAIGVAVGQIILAKCGHRAEAADRFSYVAKENSDFLLREFKENPAGHGLDIQKGSKPSGTDETLTSEIFMWLWSRVKAECALG